MREVCHPWISVDGVAPQSVSKQASQTWTNVSKWLLRMEAANIESLQAIYWHYSSIVSIAGTIIMTLYQGLPNSFIYFAIRTLKESPRATIKLGTWKYSLIS